MRLIGNTVGESILGKNEAVANKLFQSDPAFRKCRLYDWGHRLLEEVDAKFQVATTYTILKDQVEYLVQFRPHFHPEKTYKQEDGKERLGFYIDIPDDDGDLYTWLIVGRNDNNQYVRYNILKCNHVFKWIHEGVVYSYLGVHRSRNSYNSGVWSSGFVTTVENQEAFWLPTTEETQTINYDTRFITSDRKINPLVFAVTKIEDSFPTGVTKFTLKQDHFNYNTDNVELGIADYYKGKVLPKEEPTESRLRLTYDGVSNKLFIGGSGKTIRAVDTEGQPLVEMMWSISFNGKELSESETENWFQIHHPAPDALTIGCPLDYANLSDLLNGVVEITAAAHGETATQQLEVVKP